VVGIVLISLAFAPVGLLIGRWWAVGVPLIGWPLFFLGLNQGWWGSGLGETWGLALGLLMVFGAAGTVVGILLRKLEPWAKSHTRRAH
jgi:hypothetical protein